MDSLGGHGENNGDDDDIGNDDDDDHVHDDDDEDDYEAPAKGCLPSQRSFALHSTGADNDNNNYNNDSS